VGASVVTAAVVATGVAGTPVADAQTVASANATGNATPTSTTSPSAGGQLSPRLVAVAPPAVAAADPTAADARAKHAVDHGAAPAHGPGSLVRQPDGRYVVQVRLTDTSIAAQDRLRSTGATIVSVNPEVDTITVAAAADQLAAVAKVSGVIAVTEVLQPISNATCPTGIVSEGDTQLNAASARSTFGVDGSGVKVGILSDSFNALGQQPTDVANAELPGPGNPCGFGDAVDVESDLSSSAGGTDEGRAIGQIVHDLAPGADLAFATADGGPGAMANSIRQLQQRGAKVIVDDVTYTDEPMYQDGVIARAVDDVTAAGTTYVSSAGNSNLLINGQNVGSYEATAGYRSTTCPAAVQASGTTSCHNFNTSGSPDPDDIITVPAGGVFAAALGWDEPMGGVTTDLDLYALGDNGSIVGMPGTVDNVKTGAPTELYSWTNESGNAVNLHLVVGRNTGASPRFKLILLGNVSAVEHNASSGSDIVGPTLFGHNGAQAAETVGATPFNNSSVAESFSARGPATSCWQPVGTGPGGTDPAAPISPCQTKGVDVTATDGVANSFFGTSFFGVHRFFGTSAAAPHAAAVAALQLQARSCRTPAQVILAQRSSATAISDVPSQGAVGGGLVNAVGAINALAPCPATHFAVSLPSPTVRFLPATAVVTALDASNRTATAYAGTVHFSSGDAAAQLPADTTLTNGVGTVSVAFGTLGVQSLTATDTANTSITGSGPSLVSNPAPVAPVPGLARQPIVTGPTLANADGRLELFAVQADHSVQHIF
jgi:hypothetical protein